MLPRRARVRPVPLLTITAVAGLAWLLPAPAARAQFSYGYDSFVYGYAPAQAYYSRSGYASGYTDPTTGIFRNGTVAPDRTLTPYEEPPFGTFGRASSTPSYYGRPTPVTTAPTRPAATAQRRGIVRRLLGRR